MFNTGLVACTTPLMLSPSPTAFVAAVPNGSPTIVSDNATTYYNRGNGYATNGDYDRAIADFDKAIQLQPDDAIAYNNRGLAYFKEPDYNRAIADLKKVVEISSEVATTSRFLT